MILIFGGAYQGKREFAKEQFGARTVYECADAAENPAPAGDAGAAPAGDSGAETASMTGADPAAAETLAPIPDFTADAVCGLEHFAWVCCSEDPEHRIEAKDWMREHRDEWQDKVLIITDVSQGIVPMDARTRAFREMNGRLMLYLAAEADEVWRVFCGIGKRIR